MEGLDSDIVQEAGFVGKMQTHGFKYKQKRRLFLDWTRPLIPMLAPRSQRLKLAHGSSPRLLRLRLEVA